MSKKQLPKHVAIIMDGNGRWAVANGWRRNRGHEQGASIVPDLTRYCKNVGIQQLTLYSLSVENIELRPKIEIDFLMELLVTFLKKEWDTFFEENIRFKVVGDWQELPEKPRQMIAELLEKTKDHQAITLCLALNYGSRREIVRATRALAEQVKAGQLNPEDIDEKALENEFYQNDMPEPDLLIRTAGEMRISNFLLWQLSYSEIWVTDVYWPDFSIELFEQALQDYGKRSRRFGGLISSG